MFTQKFRQFLSCMLLGVFLLYITPKEIYHALVTHTDTRHQADGRVLLSGEHHHCELQKVDQQFNALLIEIPYYAEEEVPDYPLRTYVLRLQSGYHAAPLSGNLLRGPPCFA